MWGAAPRLFTCVLAALAVAPVAVPAASAVTRGTTATPPAVAGGADFNGDGVSEYAVFRPADGTWYVRNVATVTWGVPGDLPVPGDYNNDRRTDYAVFRPVTGTWFVRGIETVVWGTSSDVPVPGDYDGDGDTDIAYFRPADGTWYVRGQGATTWGMPGDIPVPGDYNGDRRTDYAVYRPGDGTWYVRGVGATTWGVAGDLPQPGDYNGDGRSDYTVYRPSNRTWYARGIQTLVWGQAGDIPAPGDFGGDGRTDYALYRPAEGTWYVYGRSPVTWGVPGDVPIGSRPAVSDDLLAPTPPGNLRVSSRTATSITLSWDAATDNNAVGGYGAYLGGNLVYTITGTTFTFAGLGCGNSYDLAVDAYDNAGNRSGRTSITAATADCPPPDTTPPSQPTGLAVTNTTSSSLTLTWNAASDDVGVTGYGRYRDNTLVSSGASTSYTYTGLACNTGYLLAVDAYDAAGNRSPKATLSATTGACSPGDSAGSALPARLAQSTGTTFYVSTSGADSNPGTLAAPWRTIQKALNTLAAGQRALVRAGTYNENLTMSRAGTAAAPITVEAYPGERPMLNAVSTHPLRVSSTGAYFRFSGFVIQNHPGTSGGNVDVYGHHVEISNNEIRASKDQGIYTAEESHHDQFLSNWIHDNGEGIAHQSHGIYLQGDDHLVANNVITDHPEGFGIQVYDRNSRSIVTSNTIVSSGHSGIVVGGPGGVDNIVVRNNVLAFNAHYGISHDSTCPASSVADHNVVFGNSWGGTQSGCSGLSFAGGNSTGDPLFVDYAARNLRVQAGSSAVGLGLVEWAFPIDYDGVARPQGGAADAGAYER